MNVIKQIKQTD